MNKNIYITHHSSINSVFLPGNNSYPVPACFQEGIRLKCHEPDYNLLLTDSAARRRMSRAVKMGMAAALQCLSGFQKTPEAIITATGLGCLSDTEKFLRNIQENNEELLNPTPFIQSIFNTVGAQLAISLQTMCCNNTFVHRGLSFENALIDAVMLLAEDDVKNALVGSFEEMTETSCDVFSRLGWNRGSRGNGEMGETGEMGEGAQFFVLSTEEKSCCLLKDIAFSATEVLGGGLQEKLSVFLSKNCIASEEIDCLVSGESGRREEQMFYEVVERTVPCSSVVTYKHLSGEYMTVSSFALWLSAQIFQNGDIPDCLIKHRRRKNINNILIYNNFRNINHSFILLKKE